MKNNTGLRYTGTYETKCKIIPPRWDKNLKPKYPFTYMKETMFVGYNNAQ